MTMYFVAQPSHLQLMSPDKEQQQQQQQHWQHCWLNQTKRSRRSTTTTTNTTTSTKKSKQIRILRTCYLLGALVALTCLLGASSVRLVSATSNQQATATGVADPQEERSQDTQRQQQQRQQQVAAADPDTGRAREPEQQQQLTEKQQVLDSNNLKTAGAKPKSTTTTATNSPSDVNDNAKQEGQRRRQQVDELRHDQLHKLMSEKDLRRTFHVERHDQVPEYQIVKLTVASDGSHLISPISDLGELLEREVAAADDHKNHHQRTTTSGEKKKLEGEEESQVRVKRSATMTTPEEAKVDQMDDKQLLVMSLSTFGKDFSLRLKRNADFQKRIKDMKMFLAESMGDGQLKYTEIKPNQQQHSKQQQHQRHKQEPHKRAAEAETTEDADKSSHTTSTSTSTSTTTTTTTTTTPAKTTASGAATSTSGNIAAAAAGEQTTTAKGQGGDRAKDREASADWIGSAYHDEENLAAILVERDRRTGQLKLDGTIGNDFVIKPMPRATIEALVARQAAATRQPTTTFQVAHDESTLASLDLERSSSATASTAATPTPTATATATATSQLKPNASTNNATPDAPGVQPTGVISATHLHDDDPHDDDEMFLDEDEALELAQLQASAASAGESNHTTGKLATNLPQQQQPRTLSKVASERKWRKYRKMLAAQTQVPKETARARRHTNTGASAGGGGGLTLSHHIIFRQQPSSEASSDEHQHSFMLAPGQQSMEAMARRFPAAGTNSGRGKRSTGPEMIDRPAAMDDTDSQQYNSMGGGGGRLSASDFGQEADFAHDPMGGQFYLEPASMTGFERAGYADWTLGIGKVRSSGFMSPPYVLNSTHPTTTKNNNSTQRQQLREEEEEEDELIDLAAHTPGSEGGRRGRPAHTNSTAAAHARYKRHAPGAQRAGGVVRPLVPMAAHPSQQRGRRHKRQAPDVVWPEVLLVVDYDSFLLHGGDSREVKRYFVSFWNGVDLRYKLLVNPHIRISLAGMIVAKDRDATPYLERNRLRAPNADAVDAAGALTDMGKYLYREDRLPTYDLAVVITKLDMCRRRYEGGRCNRGTAGFAYVGGACVVNKRLEKVNSVAIIEDSGGFSGIIVAAHEVGHLLGCVHDGSPPPSYLGGPGATHCPWEDGFIMSDLRHTERGFRWSQCSVEQFKHFLNGETATCLYNYPHESQMLNRQLPGHMLSLDDQCKRDRGTNACFKDARVCAQLFCFDSASGYCVSYRPAAEGSPCGDGHQCRNGKCVGLSEMENIIPDYTHQSQTVVAAAGRGAGRPLVVGGPVLPPARLADNGLSASSTSTATSSPDNKVVSSAAAATATGGGGGGSTPAAAPQISSRMDSLAEPLVEYGQPLPINYHSPPPPPPQAQTVTYNHPHRQAVYQPQPHLQQQAHSPYRNNQPTMKNAKLVRQSQAAPAAQARAAGPAQTVAAQLSRYAPDLSHIYHNLQSSSVSPNGQTSGNINNMRRYQQSLNYQQPSGGGGLMTSASSSSPYTKAAAGNTYDSIEHSNSNLFSSSSGSSPLVTTSTTTTSGAKLSTTTTTSRTPQPPAIAVSKKRQAQQQQVQQSSARQLAPIAAGATSSAVGAAGPQHQRLNYKSAASTPSGSAHRSQQQPQSLDHNHHHNHNNHHHQQKPLTSHNYDYYNRQQQQQQHHLLQSTPVN